MGKHSPLQLFSHSFQKQHDISSALICVWWYRPTYGTRAEGTAETTLLQGPSLCQQPPASDRSQHQTPLEEGEHLGLHGDCSLRCWERSQGQPPTHTFQPPGARWSADGSEERREEALEATTSWVGFQTLWDSAPSKNQVPNTLENLVLALSKGAMAFWPSGAWG